MLAPTLAVTVVVMGVGPRYHDLSSAVHQSSKGEGKANPTLDFINVGAPIIEY